MKKNILLASLLAANITLVAQEKIKLKQKYSLEELRILVKEAAQNVFLKEEVNFRKPLEQAQISFWDDILLRVKDFVDNSGTSDLLCFVALKDEEKNKCKKNPISIFTIEKAIVIDYLLFIQAVNRPEILKKDPNLLEDTFRRLRNKTNELLKNFKQQVNSVSTRFSKGPKEAKEILNLLISIYENVLKKIDSEYRAEIDLASKMPFTEKNLKNKDQLISEIRDIATSAFLNNKDINLTNGPITTGPIRGLTHENLDLWSDLLRDVESFVINSKSSDFPKFVNSKSAVSIWSVNKRLVQLIDDISRMVQQDKNRNNQKITIAEGNKILEFYNEKAKEIKDLILKLDNGISISTIQLARIEAKMVLKNLINEFTNILNKIGNDIRSEYNLYR